MKSAKKAVKKAAVARKKAVAKKKAAVARPKVDAVAAAQGKAKVDPRTALREEYTIEAQNFGPIAEAKLTLKPLTVLIGPSNTGKTYMAMLAHMMLRKHIEFSRFGARDMSFFLRREAEKYGARSIAMGIVAAIDAGKGGFSALALPEVLQKPVIRRAERIYNMHMRGSMSKDLLHCYGAESAAHLVAGFRPRTSSDCKFVAQGDGRGCAKTSVTMSPKGAVSVDAELSDILLPIGVPSGSKSGWMGEIREIAEGKSSLPPEIQAFTVERALYRGLRPLAREAAQFPQTHFFPASRGGLMQARHAITIAMLKTAGRGGLTEIPSIPALPMLSAEFLTDIVRITVRPGWKHADRNFGAGMVAKMAEENLLQGEIDIISGNGGGKAFQELQIPRVVFKPYGVSTALPLSQASSMICELAPLVLHWKENEGGGVMFIEEPEAHLHPAAQTKMAGILAAMVRAGIRVVITTHSDWLLDSIANLVRQGETNSENESSLKEDEVGVYWFEPGKPGRGSKAIPQLFDNDNGYLPEDVRKESTALYNRTVPLQTALDKMRD